MENTPDPASMLPQAERTASPDTFTQRRAMLAGLGGLAAGAFMARSAQAGPLNPPEGPIQSTAGPEPRTPINLANTPGGSSDGLYRISQPGSYYLTSSINAINFNGPIDGIVIASDEVTIDLNGFRVRGLAGGRSGIVAEGNRSRIRIMNGHLSNWSQSGIGLDTASSCSIENVTATECATANIAEAGIRVGSCSQVIHCVTNSNPGIGIRTLDGCLLLGCNVCENRIGIFAGNECVIRDCVAADNDAIGIVMGDAGLIEGCCARQNGSGNASEGAILVDDRSVVQRCLVANNPGFGIRALGFGCTVRECEAVSNLGGGGNPAAIECGNQATVVGNSCKANSVGFRVTGSQGFIAGNKASANGTNWNVSAGNACMVVNATTSGPVNGNSGGGSPGSTNPYANFTL